MGHRYIYTPGSDNKVHRPSHPWHALAGNPPVCEIAVLIDLQRSQYGRIDMAAPDKPETRIA